MRLTVVLNSPPKFHYWKDFGAGKKRRIPHYKWWYNIWRYEIGGKKIADHTLSIEQLPPGSRIMDAEDFMRGRISALPDELIELRDEPKTVYNHPWPYNVEPTKTQELIYCYTPETRFFVPVDDCLNFTHTLLETNEMKAVPPFEPTSKHLDDIKRQYEWSTKGDSVLVRQPRKRLFPRIDQRPRTKFGITKERQEMNVLASLHDYSQTLVAQHFHQKQERDKLSELLDRKAIGFPRCQVLFERDSKKSSLSLTIDQMSLSKMPLPQMDKNPHLTKDKEITDISPRSWRSILEQNRHYTPDWSFSLPRNSYLNTILLASRINRDQQPGEMFARSIIHSFGLTVQYNRLRCLQRESAARSADGKQARVVLEDPLGHEALREHDQKELLEEPIVLQTIGFELPKGEFHFTRYQLNTSNLGGHVKNQAWYSGPISDLAEVLRYFVDFQSFSSSISSIDNHVT